MYLTLEVISPNAVSMGANRRKTVGPAGARIGRGPENDWVIADPYISKEHARIAFVNGMFFVEGLGKNPVSVNNAAEPIANNEPRMLRSGDRLFIDEYEILVSISQGDPPSAGLGLAALVSSPREAVPSGIPESWDEGIVGSQPGAAELDPLAALGVVPGAPESALPPVDWRQAPAIASHYEPPPPMPSAGSAIPDNWDRTSFEPVQRSAPPPPPSAPASLPPASSPPARPRVPSPQGSQAAPTPYTPVPHAAPTAHVTSSAPARPAPGVASPSAASADLLELLQGAGLTASNLSPEVLRELGQVLRIVVQGVMEVLQARSEIKTHFRLPLTRIQPAQNNPLKFSPNVETALHTLLVERNRAYLSTLTSFEDAFEDIRHHQMAMLDGVRVAFEHMLESFDPERLEKELERGARRGGLLGMGGKPKFWELYGERFAALTRDRDETFRRLFGDCFGEAYEKQLERLKTQSRNDASPK